MIALIQRVTAARVVVGHDPVAAIGRGLLALVAAVEGDGEREVRRMAERLLGYRLFADAHGRMNRSLLEVGGEILVVPQFTLAADTTKGMRPSFLPAATPEAGRARFEALLGELRVHAPGAVAAGVFGADMQVELTNDGPVTFWLETKPAAR